MGAATHPKIISSARWPDEAPILNAAARARAQEHGFPSPAFGDGVWDLFALVHRENVPRSMLVLDFDRLFPNPERHLLARELAMQQLNEPVMPIRLKARAKPASPLTVALMLYDLARLFAFMDEADIRRFSDMRQEHFEMFARWLEAGAKRSSKHVASILKVLYALYEARELLTGGGLQVAPWDGRSPWKVLGIAKDSENATPRIPEAVLQPLLRWAVNYVETFSNDIRAVEHDRRVLRALAADGGDGQRKGRAKRLSSYIEGLRRNGRPLPGLADGRISVASVAASTGLTENAVRRRLPVLAQAASELGVAAGHYDRPLTALPGVDRSWRAPFRDRRDVDREIRCLIASCYVICAYLSGMRDSEVQALRVGCVEVLKDRDGRIARHYLRSRQYKGENEEGQERTWVVHPIVAKAVEVLTHLGASRRAELATDLLFVPHLSRKNTVGAITLRNGVNEYIAELIANVNERLASHIGSEAYPRIPIETFMPVTTRMFRRAVAWFIANQPFGSVAGMIQYGHLSTQMFEGYAGSSESGFRQEVETEREMARQGDIVTMYEDWKRSIEPAGPKAEDLKREFAYIREQLDDFPGKVADLGRRDRMLSHMRLNLHPGLLADCFFEPKDARCLKHLSDGERREPVAGICDPHCPNACWLKKHLPVWEHALDDVERLGKRNRISPIQRDILARKKAEYRRVIASIMEATHAD